MKPLTLTKLFTIANLSGSWQQVQEKFRHAPFRDIIDYRDYHVFINEKVRRLRHDILSIRYRCSYSVKARSQKGKGINRVLTYFHPADLIVYNLLCQHVHRCAQKGYFKNSYFSRSLHSKKDDLIKTEGDFFHEPYGGTFKEWKRYAGHRAKLGRKKSFAYAVITDIANFFETLHHETIKDLVAPIVKNPEITNLLLLILADQILRPKYSAHLRLGIPQDSFDCSRVLANLALIKLDRLLDKRTSGEWVRWMDDMTMVVRSEPAAHALLRDITEHLREDGLSLNTAKTKILKRKELKKHLLLVENALLDRLKVNITAGRPLSSARSLKSLWAKLERDSSPTYWDKVVARVFNLSGQLRDPFLLPSCYELLVKYPRLHQCVFTYLESIPYEPEIMKLIERYVQSGFDLYEEVRVRLLEALINLDLPNKDRTKSLNIAWKYFLGRQCQDQEYSRAAALLVICAYGRKGAYKRLQKIYEGAEPKNFSQVIRRYLAGILLSGDKQFHDAVLDRATYETGDLAKDLIVFAMHSIARAQWDPKTKAAFKPVKRGYSDTKYIAIRKTILLGILTHHPNKDMRNVLLDIVEKELREVGVTKPRANCRTDELLFELLHSRR